MTWTNAYYVKTVQSIDLLKRFLNQQCIKMKLRMDSTSLNRNYVCIVESAMEFAHMMQLKKSMEIMLLTKRIVPIAEHVRMRVLQGHSYSKEILKIQ